MLGEVKSKYDKASWVGVVYLTAAEEEYVYHFVKDVVHLLQQGNPVTRLLVISVGITDIS